ncbi:c-type cytochrome [Pedobacter alpinus]|uniref:C-type cytochrome n=1 Tax=Pedobacter alpinus TaxID=1590643 RepID=A0ABW5TV78_9SPHI
MRKAFLILTFSCFVLAIFLTACVNEDSIKYQRYYADGSQLYKTHCANCHMDDGKGLAALIPPLTDTTYLIKNREKLVCFIVYGMKDSIVINGIDYQGVMPAEKHLAPIDLAKTLTYITNSFGNKQGIYDVTEVDKFLKACN